MLTKLIEIKELIEHLQVEVIDLADKEKAHNLILELIVECKGEVDE